MLYIRTVWIFYSHNVEQLEIKKFKMMHKQDTWQLKPRSFSLNQQKLLWIGFHESDENQLKSFSFTSFYSSNPQKRFANNKGPKHLFIHRMAKTQLTIKNFAKTNTNNKVQKLDWKYRCPCFLNVFSMDNKMGIR